MSSVASGTAEPATVAPGRLLKVTEVIAQTSLSRSSIYRAIEAGTFPKQVRIAPQRVAWREHDIAAWKAALSPPPSR